MEKVDKMSRDEVAVWLGSIGLPEYSAKFLSYGVDGSMLMDFDHDILEKELGVTKILHRKKILREIQQMRGKAAGGLSALACCADTDWIYSSIPRDGLIIYHPATKKSAKFLYASSIWTNFSGTIRVGEDIFMFGGEAQTKEHMNQALLLSLSFEEKKVNVKILPVMPTARSCPALASYKSHFIFVVGGYTGGAEPYPATTSCETYDITKNSWEAKKPSLNEARAQPAICIQKNVLYCFGGSNYWPKSIFSLTTEYYNIEDPEAKWEFLVMVDSGNVWSPRRSFLAVPYKTDEILMFGGYYQDKPTHTSYVYNTTTKAITSSTPLPVPAYFEYAQPFFYGSDLFFTLDTSLNFYSCDLTSLTWNRIPGTDLFPDWAPASVSSAQLQMLLLARLLSQVPNS